MDFARQSISFEWIIFAVVFHCLFKHLQYLSHLRYFIHYQHWLSINKIILLINHTIVSYYRIEDCQCQVKLMTF